MANQRSNSCSALYLLFQLGFARKLAICSSFPSYVVSITYLILHSDWPPILMMME